MKLEGPGERGCLEALEEIWDVTSPLQRHLGRFPDKGNFHQVSSQDTPGQMCKGTPPGAQQLWRKKPAPTMSSVSPLPKRPLPRASSFSPALVSIHSDSSLRASPTPQSLLPLDSLPPTCFLSFPTMELPSTSAPRGSLLSLPQGDPMAVTLGTTPQRSSPGSPWRPAIGAAKEWSFSTLTHLGTQKNNLPHTLQRHDFGETPETGR
ncbi:hypothetical protein Celaphus_00017177 [Cervus elaphus hippelaphus]|uniref:SPATA31-like domain-containing protein n=1 Tax=Cervus elaphus hippelaphus TaxID=46360 RepID=A0A212CN35_CEREH|nr:hypothetical protein Celaphus_00017177 [Cervus elaphus hippelaphus]